MLKFASNRSSLAVYFLTCASFITTGANAEVGVVQATGAFQLPGGNTTTYVSEVGDPSNPRIQGYNFGNVNTLTGQTLLLQNFYFENYANYNGTSKNWLDEYSNAWLHVAIVQGTTQISNSTYNMKINGWVQGSDHCWWDMANGKNTNLAAGLASGDYTVSFNVVYTYNENATWGIFVDSSETGASTGTFTILPVPGPGAFALLGLAGFIGTRRRST